MSSCKIRGFSAMLRVVACLGVLAIGGVAIMVFWPHERKKSTVPNASIPSAGEDRFAAARREMVKWDLADRDISDAGVLAAMGRVARERFVPADLQSKAYEDYPLPIGHNQTISQPYIVALMTQLARPTPSCKALEIGVGSGYQAAVLAELCGEVYGIEILPELAESAAARLKTLGYRNVTVRCGDGYQGWPEHAPFDIIIVSAAPDHVPQPLVEQLAVGGRLVLPVGRGLQELLLLEKQADGNVRRTAVAPVQFVPMTGRAEEGP